MGYIDNIKWSVKKRLKLFEQMQTWKKYGNETRFHFNNPKIHIGEFTYGIPEVCVYDNTCSLYIGKYCSIAKNVVILLGGQHHLEYVSTYPFYDKPAIFPNAANLGDCPANDTVIGNDVWIGRGVTILSGVKIGNGAVIGSGALVSKNVDAYSVVVGNPLRHIKYRFDLDTIAKLESLRWWDLSPEDINELIPFINNPEEFILKYSELMGGNTGRIE